MDGGKFVFMYQVSNIPNTGAYANFLKFLGKFKIPTLPLLLFRKKSLSRYDENVTKLMDIYIYRSRRLHESIELTFHSPLGGILENESGNSPD